VADDGKEKEVFEERLCLYPPNGRWYNGYILKRHEGKVIFYTYC